MKYTIVGKWLVGFALLGCMAALAACQGGSGASTDAPNATVTTEVVSGARPNAAVSGSVTYRERLALSPGARLEVELRDTSYQDAAAPLIARQVIENPGQVPIKFKVEYNKDDIDPRSIYSIQSSIIESDGRLAFINDTAYDVITGGNPREVDMVLVMVQPPPPAAGQEAVDPNDWVAAPYSITGAEMLPPHEGDFLRVFFLQSNLENCSRLREHSFEIDGNDIRVSLTHNVPPPAPWAAPCDEQLVELDEFIDLTGQLTRGEVYRVLVNDRVTSTFSRPDPDFPFSALFPTDVPEVELQVMESSPPRYSLLISYGIPSGSGCSRENGYSSRLADGDTIDIQLTYHGVVPGEEAIACTADYPTGQVTVPLGFDFEPGQEYTVRVNGEERKTFVAQ